MNPLPSRTAAHPASRRMPAQAALSMTAQSPASQAPSPQTRHEHRERDFGHGYGSSSGYGARRTYTRAWRPGMFTFR